jgi:hypothetical protein
MERQLWGLADVISFLHFDSVTVREYRFGFANTMEINFCNIFVTKKKRGRGVTQERVLATADWLSEANWLCGENSILYWLIRRVRCDWLSKTHDRLR